MNRHSSDKSRSRIIQAAVIIPLALVLLLGMLVIVFLINNRPPVVHVPTPKMPKDNGWDYFVKAGDIIGRVQHPGPYSSTRPPNSWSLKEYESFMKDNAPALAWRGRITEPQRHREARKWYLQLYGFPIPKS